MKYSVLATLLAAVYSVGVAAADYYVVVPAPGRIAASSIAVSLHPALLPDGVVGRGAPEFNFSDALSVTGDPNFDPANVRWNLVSGALPAGMSLNQAGVLSGTPTAEGEVSFEIQALYQSKPGTQRYVMTIQARGSVATLYGVSTLAWGAIARADLPQMRSIAVGNLGDRPLSLTAVAATAPFALVGNSCAEVLPGASCILEFQLLDAVPGDYGPVTVSLNGASDGDSVLNLAARVLGPLAAAETATSLDFGSVTQSEVVDSQAVTWRNSGNTAMSLVAGPVNTPFTLVSNNCVDVAPGAACAMAFTMSAVTQGAYGPTSVSLSGGGDAVSVSLKGQVLAYNLTTSLNPVAFGTVLVGTSATETVTVTNASSVRAPLTVGALTAPFSQTNDCPANLDAGASCDVTVNYNPTDNTSKSSTLSVASVSIPVSGTGDLIGIETAGAGRRWKDGTYAATCKGYLTPSGYYRYAGATGSAVYTIDPDGAGAQPAVDVYCDMTSDGGGWMLLANYGRNFYGASPLMSAAGDYNTARNPANLVGYSGSVGLSRWANAFGFSTSRLEVVAGDDASQVATFYKTVTYANMASWGVTAAVEPHPTRTCTDRAMTQNCTTVPFDHLYFGSQGPTLIMHGVDLRYYGYPAGSNVPVHGGLEGMSGGFCSNTGNSNNNQWRDSYGDGHWGNGLRVWLR